MNEKVESGLQDIDNVTKVVIGHKAIVRSTASKEEAVQLVC